MRYMQVHTYTVGVLSTNCYVVFSVQTREAIIIDPGLDLLSEAGQIVRFVDKSKLKVKFIVNTHGHSDHICGDRILKEKYGVPICIHTYDAHFLEGLDQAILPVNIFLEDGELIKFGKETLTVMHTPGHTSGGASFVGENLVFTGDTLFAGGVGRTNFPESSGIELRRSLRKLLCLPDDYVVYPGHGAISTIGEEKRANPFLQRL
jgi:hydroxyacylglutathione hydrolase